MTTDPLTIARARAVVRTAQLTDNERAALLAALPDPAPVRLHDVGFNPDKHVLAEAATKNHGNVVILGVNINENGERNDDYIACYVIDSELAVAIDEFDQWELTLTGNRYELAPEGTMAELEKLRQIHDEALVDADKMNRDPVAEPRPLPAPAECKPGEWYFTETAHGVHPGTRCNPSDNNFQWIIANKAWCSDDQVRILAQLVPDRKIELRRLVGTEKAVE